MINAIVIIIFSIITYFIVDNIFGMPRCPKCNKTMTYMGKNKDTDKDLWFCENCGTVIEK